jgi:hypothetical protein
MISVLNKSTFRAFVRFGNRPSFTVPRPNVQWRQQNHNQAFTPKPYQAKSLAPPKSLTPTRVNAKARGYSHVDLKNLPLPPHMLKTANKVVYKPANVEIEPANVEIEPAKEKEYDSAPIDGSYREKPKSFATETSSESSDLSFDSNLCSESKKSDHNPFKSSEGSNKFEDGHCVNDDSTDCSEPKAYRLNPFKDYSTDLSQEPEMAMTMSSTNPFNPFNPQFTMKTVFTKQVSVDIESQNMKNEATLETMPAPSQPVEEPASSKVKHIVQTRLVGHAFQTIHDQKYNDRKQKAPIEKNNMKTAHQQQSSSKPASSIGKITSIPMPQVKSIKAIDTFEISIVEFNSPSQFKFQFGLRGLGELTDEIK